MREKSQGWPQGFGLKSGNMFSINWDWEAVGEVFSRRWLGIQLRHIECVMPIEHPVEMSK